MLVLLLFRRKSMIEPCKEPSFVLTTRPTLAEAATAAAATAVTANLSTFIYFLQRLMKIPYYRRSPAEIIIYD